jgi:hypothetical protein
MIHEYKRDTLFYDVLYGDNSDIYNASATDDD